MSLTRRALLQTGASMFAGTAVGVLGHGYAYEREALRAISADLPVAGLAPEHDGVRVGLITDLHHSQFTTQSDVARAVELAGHRHTRR
jgi:hypothetical protein